MRVKRLMFVLFLAASCQHVMASAGDTDAFVKLKRASLWVPNLDRAIVFFRDVLGFQLDSVSGPEVMDDAVTYGLFNADPSLAIRGALFSSSTERRTLYVMETKNAPELTESDPRYSGIVVQTNDLEAVVQRATERGFRFGPGNHTELPQGKVFKERIILGPGGQATLVYELQEPEEATQP